MSNKISKKIIPAWSKLNDIGSDVEFIDKPLHLQSAVYINLKKQQFIY